MACVWCLKHGCTNSLLCLKTWRFNICSSRQNLGMSELNFFGWPFDRKTNQQLFWALCYIFKRSSTGDWLLLTTLQSLSFFLHHENVWNVVQGNPKFLKFLWWSMPLDLPPISCIFTAYMYPLSPSPHEKSWLHTWFIHTVRIDKENFFSICRKKT